MKTKTVKFTRTIDARGHVTWQSGNMTIERVKEVRQAWQKNYTVTYYIIFMDGRIVLTSVGTSRAFWSLQNAKNYCNGII